MKKIKVLQVIGGLNMGGAETFIINVFRNIDREKYEFYFLCYGKSKYDYEDEVNKLNGHIIRMDKIRMKNVFKQMHRLKKIIKGYNIDIIHTHTYYNSMIPVLVAHNCKLNKIIVHAHSTLSEINPTILKKLYYKISKLIINKYSTDLIACGKEAGDSIYYKKYEIIENGINLNNFYFKKEIYAKKRKELNISLDTTVIGHVGRFCEAKNHKFILEIFAEYLKINSNAILLLIGDGPLKNDIVELAQQLKILSHIKILSKRYDVNELYSAMDLFIFPSLYEGIPLVLIEAQANGLPIIASNKIDKDVNISKKVIFKPLNYASKKEWVAIIENEKGKRYNCKKTLESSAYNMKKNIDIIEKKYSI